MSAPETSPGSAILAPAVEGSPKRIDSGASRAAAEQAASGEPFPGYDRYNPEHRRRAAAAAGAPVDLIGRMEEGEPMWSGREGILGRAVKGAGWGMLGAQRQVIEDVSLVNRDFLNEAEEVAKSNPEGLKDWYRNKLERHFSRLEGSFGAGSYSRAKRVADAAFPESGDPSDSEISALNTWRDEVATQEEGLKEAFGKRDELRPKWISENPYSAKGLVHDITEVSVRMAPGMLASAVLRSPTPMMLSMAPDVYGTQLREGLERGMTRDQARARAFTSAMLESATERIPVEHMLSLGKPAWQAGWRSLLKAMGSEGTQEAFVEAANKAADATLAPSCVRGRDGRIPGEGVRRSRDRVAAGHGPQRRSRCRCRRVVPQRVDGRENRRRDSGPTFQNADAGRRYCADRGSARHRNRHRGNEESHRRRSRARIGSGARNRSESGGGFRCRLPASPGTFADAGTRSARRAAAATGIARAGSHAGNRADA